MGALAHYLETEGIPTTQISLIREHTEIIRPPRALWVPFELGRPLGAPNDPAFQRRVLLSALELLEASEGPLLVEFPDDAPEKEERTGMGLDGWACPVNLVSASRDETDTEKLLSAFRREVMEFRPWYDLALKERGRTAIWYFAPEAALELLSDFILGAPPHIPEQITSLPVALRLAAQDLKTFYFEAIAARPDITSLTSGEFNRWFWRETIAGRVLKMVKEKCVDGEDEELKKTGAMFIVPLDEA